MTRPNLALAATCAMLALAGCQYLPWYGGETDRLTAPPEAEIPVAVTVPAPTPAPSTEPAACDVLASRDWSAWINRMPGPGAVPAVHVTGKVDVRTGGYTFAWTEGPMDRSAVPALRLKLVTKAPDGMALQAITTEEVQYAAPALAARYSRVIIGCGETTLAEITDIMDVQ